MLDEGISREIINRIQKLRKKSNLVVSDEVTLYFKGNDTLAKIVKEFQEPIEATTKSPIRPMPSKIPTKEIARESFDLKGSKLELAIAEGFCKDYARASTSAGSGSGGKKANSASARSSVERSFCNGSPQCGFVNVSCGSKVGVVLLENPKGKNEISNAGQLMDIVQDLFGIQVHWESSCQ